jgi:hypothetical protein
MSEREQKIRAEAQSLWRATRSGPPPRMCGSDLLDLVLKGGEVAEYNRLHSPHLRPGAVIGGRPRR